MDLSCKTWSLIVEGSTGHIFPHTPASLKTAIIVLLCRSEIRVGNVATEVGLLNAVRDC